MTYYIGRTEYLTHDENRIMIAVRLLHDQGRTGNNSQVASYSGLSRAKVGELTTVLSTRGYLRDVSKGAAYHWRVTDKEVRIS